MKNELLNRYYDQIESDHYQVSYTFYDVYEVALSSSSGASKYCYGCCLLLLCYGCIGSNVM